VSISTLIGHGLAHEAMGSGFGVAGTAVSYATNSLVPIEAPSVEQLMDLAIRGWISEDALKSGCLLHGVSCDTSRGAGIIGGDPGQDLNVVWKQAYYAKQELPTQIELREIANRQFWADGRLDDALKRYGYYSPANRQWVTNLRYDIPGPADLVRFSVRHVWEPDLVAALSYDREFPGAIIDVWHAMKGLDYPLFSGPFASQIDGVYGTPGAAAQLSAAYAANGIAEPTWARAYWWSHWVLPSPTQGYQMWARLNPQRDRRYDAPEMEGLDFDYNSLNLLLRANDYPPYYRPLLAAISRPVPGVRFAGQFATTGVYDLAGLYEWAARQNYGPQDAADIANNLWQRALAAKKKTTSCAGCKVALDAYTTGVIDRTSAVELLVGYGVEQDQAEQQVDLADLGSQVKRSKEVVSAIRRQYLTGGLDDIAARQALLNYGLVMSRIDQYIEDWTVERQFKFREISAGKLVSWACKGLISGDDLDRRLATLGYDAAARSGLVAEAAYCAAQLAARAAAQIARAEQQQQRAALQAQKQAAAAYKALAQMLAGRATPKDLRKWYCEGLITAQEVHSRLTYLGWPDADVTRLISDCKSGKSGGQQG
jgi:hypothetical protein